jgi:hypothetical protein
VKLKNRHYLLKRPVSYLLIFLVVGFSAFGQKTFPFIPIHANPVNTGETIEYKVNFGFFTVGKAEIRTSPRIHTLKGRPCYKIEVQGKTSGAVDWVARIDDTWGAYVDTLAFLPYMSFRNIKENNYRKNEVTRFDHQKLQAELKVLNQKTGAYKDPKIINTDQPARDIVSGYAYLRTLDYSKRKPGDTISLYGLFEDEDYHFKVLYEGKETLKTKLGKIKAIKLVPVMPSNKLFSGENAISIWLSDDANKIPLKVEANMLIGSAGCEITGYNSLKKELVAQ